MKTTGYVSLSVCLVLALVANLAITPLLSAAQSQSVPRNTRLRLILNNDLSTRTTQVGDQFQATVVQDVRVNGRTAIPRGAIVQGTVTEVERAKRLAGLSGRASMTLRFDRIRTNGQSRPIYATLVSVHDPLKVMDDEEVVDDDVDIDDEGEIEAELDITDILTKGAIGVATGALLGALFGNVSRGAILGSIGGAVAILAPKGKDVVLNDGTGLQIRLDRDLNMTIT